MESCGGQACITANGCHLFPSFLIQLLSKHQHIPSDFCKKEECSTKQRANDSETIKSIVWFSVGREGHAGEVAPFHRMVWESCYWADGCSYKSDRGDLLSPEKPISQPVPHDLEEGHNLNSSMIYESLQRDQKHWDCVMWILMLLTIS